MDDGFVLKKVDLQFLWDRTKDTAIPGHAALYSDRGVGQGHNYIEDYLRELVDNRPFSPATGTGSGLDKWNEIRNNEVYIWKKKAFQTEEFSESEFIEDRDKDIIGWELPIVPVQDAHTTVVSTTEVQKHLETLSNQDLEIYSLYLKGIEPPQGEEINPEQVIKMKFPKKLQKEIRSKSIKLSKAEPQIGLPQETERLFT